MNSRVKKPVFIVSFSLEIPIDSSIIRNERLDDLYLGWDSQFFHLRESGNVACLGQLVFLARL